MSLETQYNDSAKWHLDNTKAVKQRHKSKKATQEINFRQKKEVAN